MTITVSSHLDPSCTWTRGEILASDVTLDCQGAHLAAPDRRYGIHISAPTDTALVEHHRPQLPRRGLPQQHPHHPRRLPRPRRGRRVRPRLLQHHDRGQHPPELARRRHLRRRLRRPASPSAASTSRAPAARASTWRPARRTTSSRTTTIVNNGFGENGPYGQLVRVRAAPTFWFWGTGREGLAIDGSRFNRVVNNRFSRQRRRRHLPLQELRRVREPAPGALVAPPLRRRRQPHREQHLRRRGQRRLDRRRAWARTRCRWTAATRSTCRATRSTTPTTTSSATTSSRTSPTASASRTTTTTSPTTNSPATTRPAGDRHRHPGTAPPRSAQPVDRHDVTGNTRHHRRQPQPVPLGPRPHQHHVQRQCEPRSRCRPLRGRPAADGAVRHVVAFEAGRPRQPADGSAGCRRRAAAAVPARLRTSAAPSRSRHPHHELDTPPGDDTLAFNGRWRAASVRAALDPIQYGVGVVLTDAAGARVLDVVVPGGAYDPVTKVGWQAARSGGKLEVREQERTPPAGITSVVIKDLSKKRPRPGPVQRQGQARRLSGRHGEPAAPRAPRPRSADGRDRAVRAGDVPRTRRAARSTAARSSAGEPRAARIATCGLCKPRTRQTGSS